MTPVPPPLLPLELEGQHGATIRLSLTRGGLSVSISGNAGGALDVISDAEVERLRQWLTQPDTEEAP